MAFTSCNSNNKSILSLNDKILKENPAQALVELDSLEKTNDLNDTEQLHVAWNRALAYQSLGISLADVDRLPEAIKHYRSDKDRRADSYKLEASYLTWVGKEGEAVKAIESGLTDISKPQYCVQLLLAEENIFENQRKYEQAIEVLKRALKYRLSKREEAIINYKIGVNLSLKGSHDSEYFYDKSIHIALEHGDTAMSCEFMRNYADYLANNGEYRRSNNIFYRIARLMPRIAELSSIQMAMSGNYINLHKLDSARICNDKAINSERKLETKGFADLARRVVIEQQQTLLDYESGQCVSYVDFARYCDSLNTDIQKKENTLIRRQEAKNRLQYANQELKLSKQRMGWMLSVAVLLLIVCIVLAYLFHRNKVQQQAEAEDRIDILTRMLKEAQEASVEKADEKRNKGDEDAFFKKILLQQLGIIRMVAKTPTNQNQALLKRISGISEGKIPTNSLLVWSDLYPIIDKLYDNFHGWLIERFGNVLMEKEVQICCLLCAGFSTKEIGVITQQSDATIYVRKTSIRKKVGVSEGQDIILYLNSIK